MSFKAEMQTDRTGVWHNSGLYFATEQEAWDNMNDLILNMRWIEVFGTRVVACNEPVNYSYHNHQLRLEHG